MSDINGMYGRTEPDGTISVWSVSTGAAVTFMPADVKPVGSELSARKNHPLGIKLTRKDALAIGLEIRGAAPVITKPTVAAKPFPAKTPDPTGQTFKAMPSTPAPEPFTPFSRPDPIPQRRPQQPPKQANPIGAPTMSSKVGYSAGKSTSKLSVATTAKYSTGKDVPGGKYAPKVGYSAGQNSGLDRDGDPKGAPANKG